MYEHVCYSHLLHEGKCLCCLFLQIKKTKIQRLQKKPAAKKRKTSLGQNILVVTQHGGTSVTSVPTSELEPCQLFSTDTAPILPMSPSRPIAPSLSFHSPQTLISNRRRTSVSPSLFSPSIHVSLLSSWYDPFPAPPSPFIPHFTLSGSATLEATHPARNISEQLSGCVQGTLCTGDCLCYTCLSYCIVDQKDRWGWVLRRHCNYTAV